jgi:hypothetical protein
MSKFLKATAAAALLACGATFAFAQTAPSDTNKQTPPPKNATQPGAPEGAKAQPPAAATTTPPPPAQGSGSAAMGPPAADTQGGPGMTKDKVDQKKSPN